MSFELKQIPLSSQLSEIKNQIQNASQKARDVVSDLSSDQLTYRTREGTWSVAECIVHLSLTTQAHLPLLKSTLDTAREQKLFGQGPFKMDWIGSLLKWSQEPPSRFKIKTTKPFQPINIGTVSEVLSKFLELQNEFIALVEKSGGIALDKIKIQSVFNERMKYNLFSCFQILAAHERRHLWQAEQVKNSLINR
jgi:hypothetical protein